MALNYAAASNRMVRNPPSFDAQFYIRLGLFAIMHFSFLKKIRLKVPRVQRKTAHSVAATKPSGVLFGIRFFIFSG
jgi:hypothetical protein